MPSMRDPALYPTACHATCTLADREQRPGCHEMHASPCHTLQRGFAAPRGPMLGAGPTGKASRAVRWTASQRLTQLQRLRPALFAPAGSSNSNCCRNEAHAGGMFQQRHKPGAHPTACWHQDAKIIVVGVNHSESLRVGDQ